MKRKILSLVLALATLAGMFITANATSGNSSEMDGLQEVLAFYEAENLNYIDEMPESLMQEYGDAIALADQYLQELYGDQVMLSDSDDFLLDKYCDKILLGLFLDLDDDNVINEIKKFTDAAAKIYIIPPKEDRSDERPAVESNESFVTVQPLLDGKNYDATAAVEYAHEWTEAGKELCNPDFHRENADCTNFVSQVLYAGGISQVSGSRTSSEAWFYEYGIIARPSYTWSGAQNLYDHLKNHSNNVERVYSTADIEVGDIISFDTVPDDNVFHIGHSAVVTKKTGNAWANIYLTYHSTDREDYPASNLVTKAGYLAYPWSIG